jgi:putative transposase
MDNRDLRSGHQALRVGRLSRAFGVYLVTTATRGREAIFAELAVAASTSRCFDEPRLLDDATMLSWVLMPDHAHWLIQLGAHGTIAEVVNRLKSASARAANAARGTQGSVWAHGFHDRAMRTLRDVAIADRYIALNPVRAGLAIEPGQYPHWRSSLTNTHATAEADSRRL